MRISLLIIGVLLAGACAHEGRPDMDRQEEATAVDVVKTVYLDCVQRGSFACVKPKVLSFLSSALKKDTIRLTRDLSIVRSREKDVHNSNGIEDSNVEDLDSLMSLPSDPAARREALRHLLLERVERFLESHQLRMNVPQELVGEDVAKLLPRSALVALPRQITVPLSPEDPQDMARHKKGRGFFRKVVIPFLLGLKFKTTALIPLALSLIALKTWKALTLGLLSLVLSGAMVIFRFTKPKVVNYDVYHFPQHHGHVDHHAHYEHGYDHGHYDHYARSFQGHQLAYGSQ